ncbi:hypothetical protein BC828DRAFT_399314 [Blastocladiella britannica]|nr:hypothetical protein BC828DRAFT_399314 [Blastocladiella britannica]
MTPPPAKRARTATSTTNGTTAEVVANDHPAVDQHLDHKDDDSLSEYSDEEEDLRPRKRPTPQDDQQQNQAMYLDTIRRTALDFDFEKVCSVSLSDLNVYACLVCGKYFAGRGPQSHAYTHAVHTGHAVYMHLRTHKFYVLPDSYPVTDASLNDIKHVVDPTYTRQAIAAIDSPAGAGAAGALDLAYKPYVPGFVGLNNVKANDYVSVVVHALARVRPLRDFFLLRGSTDGATDALAEHSGIVRQLGLLLRKIHNPRAFKAHVSPHEFLQELNSSSRRQFKLTDQGDPIAVLTWLLNAVHSDLRRRPPRSSLVFDTFQGTVAVRTQSVETATEDERQLNESKRQQGISEPREFDDARGIQTQTSPFLVLAVELPPPPLFQDEYERNIIPQASLVELLEKYNGVTVRQYGDTIKQYRVTKLPQYLIIHIKRFVKNNWTLEKNPTIVNFSAIVESPTGETRYSLVANIVHDGEIGTGKGAYKVQVHNKSQGQWYSIQDLAVQEIMPQLVALGESYIQIWERFDVQH